MPSPNVPYSTSTVTSPTMNSSSSLKSYSLTHPRLPGVADLQRGLVSPTVTSTTSSRHNSHHSHHAAHQLHQIAHDTSSAYRRTIPYHMSAHYDEDEDEEDDEVDELDEDEEDDEDEEKGRGSESGGRSRYWNGIVAVNGGGRTGINGNFVRPPSTSSSSNGTSHSGGPNHRQHPHHHPSSSTSRHPSLLLQQPSTHAHHSANVSQGHPIRLPPISSLAPSMNGLPGVPRSPPQPSSPGAFGGGVNGPQDKLPPIYTHFIREFTVAPLSISPLPATNPPSVPSQTCAELRRQNINPFWVVLPRFGDPCPFSDKPSCSRTDWRPAMWERHVQTHLPDTMKEFWECPHCFRPFNRKCAFVNHLRKTRTECGKKGTLDEIPESEWKSKWFHEPMPLRTKSRG